jgi:acetyltransferase-like isoleucine patch superfamily enzyme
MKKGEGEKKTMSIIINIVMFSGNIWNSVLFRWKKIKHGKDCSFNGKIRFQGVGENITIGDNVTINSGWRLNPTGGGEQMSISVSLSGKVEIGNGVGISNSNIRSVARITIDDNVVIGSGCRFLDSDFHSIHYEDRVKETDNHIKSAPIHIKKGAFIGAYSTVLKGVVIGERSVVGAGSVVTSSIPNDEIWGGQSGKIYKETLKRFLQ